MPWGSSAFKSNRKKKLFQNIINNTLFTSRCFVRQLLVVKELLFQLLPVTINDDRTIEKYANVNELIYLGLGLRALRTLPSLPFGFTKLWIRPRSMSTLYDPLLASYLCRILELYEWGISVFLHFEADDHEAVEQRHSRLSGPPSHHMAAKLEKLKKTLTKISFICRMNWYKMHNRTKDQLPIL